MGFRIGILKNKGLETIYVSYPNNILEICKILKENYTKITEIDNLIKLGDVYELKSNIEDTNFYCRDKGESLDDTGSFLEVVTTLDEINTENSPIQYYIIWTNKWNVCKFDDNKWTSVTKFLNKHK